MRLNSRLDIVIIAADGAILTSTPRSKDNLTVGILDRDMQPGTT